jgi:hypothetical protein
MEIKVSFVADVKPEDLEEVCRAFNKYGAEIIGNEFPELKNIDTFNVRENTMDLEEALLTINKSGESVMFLTDEGADEAGGSIVVQPEFGSLNDNTILDSVHELITYAGEKE